MGTKPVYALAGLFVVGSFLSGCRSTPSGGGYDRGPQMVGQAPTGYSSPSMAAGSTPTGTLSRRPMPQAEPSAFSGAQPMPSATTFPSATTPGVTTATPANPYGGGNAFSSGTVPNTGTVSQMPPTANYPMPSQSVQMQAPTMPSQDNAMPPPPQGFGSQAPRNFNTLAPQQGLRGDRFQSLAPGGEQQ